MILNPNGFNKEFYPQSGNFAVAASFSPPSYTGIYSLIVSGSGQNLNITLKNGKIYDNDNNFVSIYQANLNNSLLLNISPTKYDLFVNGNPIIFSHNKFSGSSTNLIIKTNEILDDLLYSISGYIPNFSYTNNIVYNIVNTGIIGYIINNDNASIKIYSGQFLGNTNTVNTLTGIILPGQSGQYIVSGLTTLGGSLLKNTLYTNFGDIPFNINVSGYQILPSPFKISLSGPTYVQLNTNSSYNGYFTSSSGDFGVNVILENISGSGQSFISIPISGNYSGNYTGNLIGSGYLNQNVKITGYGSGGAFNIANSGVLSGLQQTFAFATGKYSGNLLIVGYGYGTGNGYSGLSSGTFNVPISGLISGNSGCLYINQSFTGSPSGAFTVNPLSYSLSLGRILYNIPLNIDTSDILYVGNINYGIVYPYHYNSYLSLVSYLNANTGKHLVHAAPFFDNNTIFVQSITGYETIPILLAVDRDNKGSMAVSGPFLSGGHASGIGTPMTPVGGYTGSFNGILLNSSSYSIFGSGQLFGTAPVLNSQRNFTDIWNLYTGISYFNLTNYKSNGYFNLSSGGYINNNLISVQQRNNVYIKVAYNNYNANNIDIVRLILSGYGAATGIFSDIYITGGL